MARQDALRKGVVYNAVDACAELGLDAEALDREWAGARHYNRAIIYGESI